MRYLYKLGILTCLLWGPLSIWGQSGLKLTDYYHNPILYNPAYVGVTEGYFVKAFYATQWLGFDQAPTSQVLDIQRLTRDQKTGYGLSIFNDKFGAVQNTNLELNYALHLELDDTQKLSLGLKAGVNSFQIDYSLLDIYDPTEIVYVQGNLSEKRPIVGVGAYIYDQDWFIGFSSPNLLNTEKISEDNTFVYSKTSHFYLQGGYIYPLSDDFIWHNSLLLQMVSGSPLEYLVTSRATYQYRYTLGLQYNPGALLGAFLSAEVFDGMSLTYTYDVGTGPLSKYSYGNHSFGISYEILGRLNWDQRLEDLRKPFMVR